MCFHEGCSDGYFIFLLLLWLTSCTFYVNECIFSEDGCWSIPLHISMVSGMVPILVPSLEYTYIYIYVWMGEIRFTWMSRWTLNWVPENHLVELLGKLGYQMWKSNQGAQNIIAIRVTCTNRWHARRECGRWKWICLHCCKPEEKFMNKNSIAKIRYQIRTFERMILSSGSLISTCIPISGLECIVNCANNILLRTHISIEYERTDIIYRKCLESFINFSNLDGANPLVLGS